jgi:hypothetical protein
LFFIAYDSASINKTLFEKKVSLRNTKLMSIGPWAEAKYPLPQAYPTVTLRYLRLLGRAEFRRLAAPHH